MGYELTGLDRKVALVTGAGQPEEIGAMVVYLCSDQGAWVSGQLYSVDGGQLAGR